LRFPGLPRALASAATSLNTFPGFLRLRASSGCDGVAVFGFPRISILQRCLLRFPGLPRVLASAATPLNAFPGLPRFEASSGLRLASVRVSPSQWPFGVASCHPPGLPGILHLWPRRFVLLRVAPVPGSPSLPAILPQGFPWCSISCAALGSKMRVAPALRPYCAADDGSSGCPASPSSGFAVNASSGFPESCIYGWVDDESPAGTNFASQAET